jgi:6-phospho-beta-glucosidase
MDVRGDRLNVMTAFCRRMAEKLGSSARIDSTTQLRSALDGARFVITQIRVGGMQARIADEKLGRRHNILGQETTGVGGFACALRTIPRVLDVAHAMEEICPDALLLNFANPSGIVTEAINRHASVSAIGLCNIPIGIEMDVALLLGCAHEDVELDYAGLNHLAWVYGVRVRGEDRSEDALDALTAHAEDEWDAGPIADAMREAMRSLGMYCNPYLQYFYATEACLAKQAASKTTRGEDVLNIENDLFATYADPARNAKPDELSKRGGAHYSTAALAVMESVANDSGTRQIVCCANHSAVPGFDNETCVEVPARIGAGGAIAIEQDTPPVSIRGLMQCVKAYETLTVEAAVTGDRNAAFQAMLANPLMPGALGSKKLLDDLLTTNEPYLHGTFFPETAGVGHGI